MKIRRWAMGCALAASLVACGPRRPPPRPGETLFWKINSSTVTFTGCSDDPQFRDPLQPIAFDENTYFIYRVEKDGQKATALDCSTLSEKSCVDSPSGIAFDVAGSELVLSRQTSNSIPGTQCKLSTLQSWLGEDQGTQFTLAITNLLSLTDSPSECPQFDQQVKAQSPNGLGLAGCQVLFNVSAELAQ